MFVSCQCNIASLCELALMSVVLFNVSHVFSQLIASFESSKVKRFQLRDILVSFGIGLRA